ncbi:MAG: SH3 domain-containing protein, partial [Sulfurovaceae bacterium]|nr:SH3 domain-containing protein [Sulfurovaceae bacterium]
FSGCQEVGDTSPLLGDKKGKQPIIIVNKNRHLNIAEFWIDKIKDTDKPIMNNKEIEAFNKNIVYKQHLVSNFKDIPSNYSGLWLKNNIERHFKNIFKQTKYFEDGTKIKPKFINEIKNYMDLYNISDSVKTRYAITVHYSNQRIVPTELALLKKKGDIYFDRNQNSALDIATPLAVLHTSSDGKWHYAIGEFSSGWVRDQDIAFAEKKDIDGYINSDKFVITTRAKSSVLIAGKYYDTMRMGIKLPYILTVDDMSMVLIPTRDENGSLVLSNATIKSTHTHKGYLAYTPRNILTQAFEFLNAPYGWGGSFGEQDCSKFIQQIYATTGVRLPRNSSSQSISGDNYLELSNIDRITKENRLISLAPIGATIVHLKGHIMLYIGDYKGEPYVIQTVWGESKRHYALGRTAVTSLNFNNYIDKVDRATILLNSSEEASSLE